mgnify:CR=1 FL=1
MQTVGVALIVRNSEQTIANCVESFIEHVDQCVLVEAGKSIDKTPIILRELQAKYPKIELYQFEWIDDFSAARNFSFSKLKTDFYLWLDSDDVVFQAENLRMIAEMVKPEIGAIWFPYHYALDEFGNPTTIYERERLLRAKAGWIWRGRLHETVAPVNNCQYVRTDQVIVRHAHQAGDSRGERNFRILNIMYKEDPTDKRVWLYLAHQNFACQNWSKAAEWYVKFGRDQGAIALERYQAFCYCSKAMREMRDDQAVEVALMALELYPQYKDAYLELAQSYLVFGDYDKAIHFAKMSDVKDPLLTEPPAVIFINPLEYTFNKYALLAECYLKKNQLREAREYLVKAHEIRPVQDIKNNIAVIDQAIRREDISKGIKYLAVELLDTKELVKLPSLLAVCPYWYRESPEYAQIKEGVRGYTKDIADKPEVIEGDNTIINIGNCVSPDETLAELEKNHDHITVIAPFPTPESKQIRTYCQKDIEELLMSRPGRNIINLQSEPSRIVCEFDHKAPDNLAVRFFVGQGLEYWSPKTISERGCGGSETSAALLAKALGKKGCQSIIYGMDNQTWDRVIYRPFSMFNPQSIQSHLFISSRVPDVFDAGIPAVQKWLWAHDICFWDRLTPDRAEQIDCIIALSHWHVDHLKRCYPWLKSAEVIDMDDQDKTYEDDWTVGEYYPEDTISKIPKIAIIGDAIDTSRFKGFKEDRVPYRFIWCSSPDRGLEELLSMWPLIKKAMPEATLKIFYGWEYFDSSLHIPEQRLFKQRIRELIRQEGVEWCGRVGQDILPHELKKADAMVYPPHSFRETYGIAFLEAQAAGVMCFYRQNGALGETIGDRGIPLPMDSTPEQIVERIRTTLEDKQTCGKIRERAKKYGKSRDWEGQADKILLLYRRLNGS